MATKDPVTRLRATLLKRREFIQQSLDSAQSQIQLKRDPDVGDAIDHAVDAEHHEISSRLAQCESTELQQIDAALERMDRGEYRKCEECARMIPLARHRAVPYATLCVNCQRTHEGTSEPRGPHLMRRDTLAAKV